MSEVMSGSASDAQIAAFVVGLRAKGEDPDEVVGLVEGMLAHSVGIEVTGLSLDVVGTGGDHANLVNISTMSAIVAAAAGARVIKHGNRAASSACGSADVLEELGVVLGLAPAGVVECVETLGIGFCFAPTFHPAMRHAAAARRELGIPTVFNILGPLANPARPSASLVGCADPRLTWVMAQVLVAHGQRALVVRGDDGLDEVSTSTTTRVWDATRGDGSVIEGSLDPRELGIRAPGVGELVGGNAALNASIARAVLEGRVDGSLAAVADSVALNTAMALVADAAARGSDEGAGGARAGDPGAGDPGASLEDRVRPHLELVREVMASGAPAALLDRWVALSAALQSAD